MPATSQLERLISMTAISVPSGWRGVRHRLRSFNFCMGRSIGSHQRRWIQYPRRRPIASLFYEFCLDEAVPADHLVRKIDAVLAADLVGGEGFAVDASLIAADANKQRSIPGSEWQKPRDPERASRAVKEYMATLDDAAFGAA